MLSLSRALTALRLGLAGLFALLVLLQVMSLPGQFAHMAAESPDMAYLRWPLTAVSVFWVLCAQVVIVCTWRLLGLVHHDQIFSSRSLGWVDAIAATVAAAWTVLVGVFLYVGFRADDPGLPLLLLLVVLIVAVIGLIVLVLRTLLRQATTLRADLDAVI